MDLPNGTLSINAQPWAEVFVDGERVGETPIGNLSRRIGAHEVIFRHPELGERRELVMISVGKPSRIGVDLRKK
jgi:serine/threonine-protein kinase